MILIQLYEIIITHALMKKQDFSLVVVYPTATNEYGSDDYFLH